MPEMVACFELFMQKSLSTPWIFADGFAKTGKKPYQSRLCAFREGIEVERLFSRFLEDGEEFSATTIDFGWIWWYNGSCQGDFERSYLTYERLRPSAPPHRSDSDVRVAPYL